MIVYPWFLVLSRQKVKIFGTFWIAYFLFVLLARTAAALTYSFSRYALGHRTSPLTLTPFAPTCILKLEHAVIAASVNLSAGRQMFALPWLCFYVHPTCDASSAVQWIAVMLAWILRNAMWCRRNSWYFWNSAFHMLDDFLAQLMVW